MDHNTWSFGSRGPRQDNAFRPHESGYCIEPFSSPTSQQSDAYYDGFLDLAGFQGSGYALSPSPSVHSSNGRDRNEGQFMGFQTRPLSYTQSQANHEPSNHNMHLYHSEVPASLNPINLDQYPPRRTSPNGHAFGHRVTHGTENTTRNGFGWRLRPVSELPDRFRGVFKFGVFNAIQSACFDQVLHSEENIVISAPTGSGKTVLFELGIIRMLAQTADDARSDKCVYVAPTKALCAEKHKEWTAKFGGLGIKCCELTGDTLHLGRGVWGDAKSSHIIVTTAEKWDSLTRNWADHSGILSRVKLFLVDEVHVLNESRGSTLEVVVSRMKARGSGTRFLLVSATVPNVEDIASWIGSSNSSDRSARIFRFGEEFRPCKLTKYVYGVAKLKGQNDFAYARTLDLRLFPVLQQHSSNKPILVFCSTRRGTVDTAKQLAKDYEQAMKGKKNLPWPPAMPIHQRFHDKDLGPLASVGIAVHHAGLNTDDRRTVEELFLRKALHVLVATSTLAVGVNLPAQMVVIKGVKLYQNGEMREYSDLDIMQMMGRAGRPQFDNEGTAVILCEPELEYKYRTLVQGNTTLESSLHQNLAEHLNSEIGLGTISTVENAKDWLRHSFLFRRIQKNPHHYDIGKNENQTWEEKVDEIVTQSILSLRDTRLITYSERCGRLASTEYGDVMSKLYVRQTTMRAIINLPPSTTLREILELISVAEEVSDLKLRGGEKPMYEKIRRHNDIRFPPKKMGSTSDKIVLLIQAILAGLPLNSPEFKPTEGQPYLEAVSVFRHATRIVTAIAEVAIINRSGAQLKHALELVRCLNAKAWEDRPLVLRQIEHIGEKSVKVLAENGINSIQKLLQTSPFRVEELLNRRPPFGLEVLAAANEFPKYLLDIKELRSIGSKENSPVEVDFVVQCSLTFDDQVPQRVKKPRWGKAEMTTLLIVTSDMVLIDFRRIITQALKEKKEITLTAQLTKPSQSINVYIASETFAGITVSRTLAPSIPPDKYPTLETRPLTSILKETDLQGLEDVADFWDVNLDDSDENPDSQTPDLTKHHGSPSRGGQPELEPMTKQGVRDPRKRPDGKYECNHACKDKLKCRHYCCQEGLLEPPRRTKRQQALARDSDAKSVPPLRNVTTPKSFRDERVEPPRSMIGRSKPTKQNPIAHQSNKAHKNTAHNMGPIDSKVELAGHPRKIKTSKAVPNFDLQLTTLKRSRSPTPTESMLMDDCYDELPLISEVWKQGLDGCGSPPPKRSRKDAVPSSLQLPFSRKKVISSKNSPPPMKHLKEQLFIPDSDEDAANQCDDHSASWDPSPYLDESCFDTALDSTVDPFFSNSRSDTLPAFDQRSRDDGSTHRPSACSSSFVTTPPRSSLQPSSCAMRRNRSYILSPSRIAGFIRRSGPYVKEHPRTDSFTNDSFELYHRRTTPVTNDIHSLASVDPGNSNDSVDDPFAEFDRWLASGAVEIIPD